MIAQEHSEIIDINVYNKYKYEYNKKSIIRKKQKRTKK